jgi:hypothetical protein
MNGRIQISLDPETRRRAKARAAKLKISVAEYLRRLIAQDLSVSKRKTDVSALFDLADSSPATNIARDKDKMIAKAAKAEHSARRKKVTRKQKESEIVRSGHSEAFWLLSEAILNRKPVTLTYHGVRREVCPHIIGHTNGAERAFGVSVRRLDPQQVAAGRRVALPAAVPSERHQVAGWTLAWWKLPPHHATLRRPGLPRRQRKRSKSAWSASTWDVMLHAAVQKPYPGKIGRTNDRHRQ